MISYGGPELLLLFVVFIVTPIAYRLFLKKLERKKRIICIASLWAITFLVGYTDVILISLKARKLCREEAGLHVYKTVEAEGFLGATDIEHWSQLGFKFVEHDLLGKKTRYSILNGKVIKEEPNTLISRYEITTTLEVIETPFNRGRKIIKDRITNEVLGEIVSFAIYPGWLDSKLLGLVGFTWSPAGCDGDYVPMPQKSTLNFTDLITAVIIPK